jgi:hypothetical protein
VKCRAERAAGPSRRRTPAAGRRHRSSDKGTRSWERLLWVRKSTFPEAKQLLRVLPRAIEVGGGLFAHPAARGCASAEEQERLSTPPRILCTSWLFLSGRAIRSAYGSGDLLKYSNARLGDFPIPRE